MRIAIGAVVACLALIGLSHAADVEATVKRHTDIPAQGLAPALRSLAKDRGFQIVFASKEVSDLRTQGAVGELTTTEALTQILSGTGLTYRYLDDSTITIAPLSSNSAIPSSGATQGGNALSTSEGNLPSPREGRRARDEGTQSDEGKPKGFWQRLKLAQANSDSSENKKTDQPSDTKDQQLSEIVVTARKQEEPLQRVPVSVAVFSGEELQRRSLDSLSAIGQSVPNFNFGGTGPGGRADGVIYIRGVGQGTAGINFDPAVGVYLDGVFLSRPQGNDLDMVDIERVEILRGPQGTLFGRNTSGGAINIVTRQPDLTDFSGELKVTGGSRDRGEAMGRMNVPLATDKVALALVGARLKQDGYGSRIDGQDLGSTDRHVGRVKLLFQPTSRFNALLSLDGTEYDETNAVPKLVAVNTAALAPFTINNFTSQRFDERWMPGGDFFTYATGPNSSRGSVWGGAITLNFDAGWAHLKSISAYRGFTIHSDFDVDNSPVGILDFYNTIRQREASQELQATGMSFGDRLNWQLGAYFFHDSARNPGDFGLFTALDPGCGFCFGGRGEQKTDSYAGYGQGTYALTEKVRLTAGLRFTHDEKKFEAVNYTLPSGTPTLIVPLQQKSWSDLSPRLGFEYQWTPDIMTYVSASKGYKGGGFNGGLPSAISDQQYDPEVSLNYEIGLRSDLLDRRVRLNATAFYNDYSDLQMLIGGATTDANGNPVPFSITDNIPKVRITGGELELTAIPLRGLVLTGVLGLTHARYAELPNNPLWTAASTALRAVTIDSKFPYTPRTSYTLAAEYTTSISNVLNVSGRVDYAHKSRIFYDLLNLPELRQRSYGLVNARLSFEHEPTGLLFSLFGTNLTDEHYFTGGRGSGAGDSLGFAYVNMASPREFGASVEWRY